jgi:recombination DNA repair RAD52 pathway protein
MGIQYQELSEPFPQEMERSITKSGVSLTYIPVSEVINRLNKILGVDQWSFTILRCERDAHDPEFIVAHVRITVNTEHGWVERDGFGGQKIKRTKAGAIVDLGDEFKGAISDALKKAAQTLGVGLYLARSDEAMEIEQAMDTVPENQEAQVVWDNFINISKQFSAEQKNVLRSDWNEWSGGKPVPQKDSVTVEQAEYLLSRAAAISFNASAQA